MDYIRVRVDECKYFEFGTEVSISGLNGCTAALLSSANYGLAMHFHSQNIDYICGKARDIIQENNIGELTNCLVIYSKNNVQRINNYLDLLKERFGELSPKHDLVFRNLSYKTVHINEVMSKLSSKLVVNFSEVKITKEKDLAANLEGLRLKLNYDSIFVKPQEELENNAKYANTHTNLRF